jgi:hypothetical protein
VRRVGVSLLALGLLAGCAPRWPEENREAFSRSCLATARKTQPTAPEEALTSYCDCTADRLQDQFSLEEFMALEARSVRENKPPMELVRVVEECTGRLR